MQHQKSKKKITKRRSKKSTSSQKEPYGYQPNNPLTIYYKKYIEKQED
tara:strand:+ start:285 stop:428 length:144 start_codon:yes stop_codon:yes gene_type:complete